LPSLALGERAIEAMVMGVRVPPVDVGVGAGREWIGLALRIQVLMDERPNPVREPMDVLMAMREVAHRDSLHDTTSPSIQIPSVAMCSRQSGSPLRMTRATAS
jgi:hypothetical protein